MKIDIRQLLIFASLIAFRFSFGQEKSFEGIVKYQTITTLSGNYEDTIGPSTDTTYSSVYHKNGNFVSIDHYSNEKQVFLKKSCKIYLLTADGNGLDVFPGTLDQSVRKFDTGITKKEFLGYTCSGLKVQTETFVYTSWFSPVHFISSYDLKRCNYWNIDFEMNHIPLCVIMEENDQSYKSETVAIEIISGPVDDYLFVIPKNNGTEDIIKD